MNSGSLFLSSFTSTLLENWKSLALVGKGMPNMSSLVPYTMDGPFKKSMNFLMRLAWSSKIQLPVLIAVAFMAFDIRLQLEINIFWDANHRQQLPNNENNRFIPNRDGNAAFIGAQTTLNLDMPSDLDLDDDESFESSSSSNGDDEDDQDCRSSSDITEITSALCISECFDSDPETR